jgi:hypothetical protein
MFFYTLHHLLIELVCKIRGHDWRQAELAPTFHFCMRCSTCGWTTP